MIWLRVALVVVVSLSCSGCLGTLVRGIANPQALGDAYVDAAGRSLSGGTVDSVTSLDRATDSLDNALRENPDAVNTDSVSDLRKALGDRGRSRAPRYRHGADPSRGHLDRRADLDVDRKLAYEARDKQTGEVVATGYVDLRPRYYLRVREPGEYPPAHLPRASDNRRELPAMTQPSEQRASGLMAGFDFAIPIDYDITVAQPTSGEGQTVQQPQQPAGQ